MFITRHPFFPLYHPYLLYPLRVIPHPSTTRFYYSLNPFLFFFQGSWKSGCFNFSTYHMRRLSPSGSFVHLPLDDTILHGRGDSGPSLQNVTSGETSDDAPRVCVDSEGPEDLSLDLVSFPLLLRRDRSRSSTCRESRGALVPDTERQSTLLTSRVIS